jgi:hypothetical protein
MLHRIGFSSTRCHKALAFSFRIGAGRPIYRIRDDVGIEPTTISTRNMVEQSAKRFGLGPVIAAAGNREEVEQALDLLLGAHVEAVNVLASPILFGHHPVMIERLNDARVPAIYQWPERVAEGAFASYGPRFEHSSRLLAPLLDRVCAASNLPICPSYHRPGLN